MHRRLAALRVSIPVLSASLRVTALTVALLLARPARAQTSDDGGTTGLTIALATSITHVLPSGADFTRDSSLTPTGINFEDCEEDASLVFPLVVSGTAADAKGYLLYAFAGTDCNAGGAAVEPNVAGSTCWPIAAGAIGFAVGSSLEVKIRARQILAQANLTTKTTYSEVASGDDSMCHTQPTSAPLQLSVFFVFGTTATLTEVGGYVSPGVGADLAAAAPPSTVSVGIGHTLLLPDWSPVSDSDIVGYNVYYLPVAAADAGVSNVCREAGSSADGGDGGDGGAVTSTCDNESTIDSSPLADASADGGVPYAPNGISCTSPFPAGSTSSQTSATSDVVTYDDGGTGTISTTATIAALSMQPREVKKGAYPFVDAAGATATSATINGLTDETEYAVAIAATDAYGNVGALSTFTGKSSSDTSICTCQWPQPVSDFWTSYAGAGGKAGGGFCSASAADAPEDAGCCAMVIGAAAIFVLRRPRRRRVSSRPARAPAP